MIYTIAGIIGISAFNYLCLNFYANTDHFSRRSTFIKIVLLIPPMIILYGLWKIIIGGLNIVIEQIKELPEMFKNYFKKGE